jgi:hypothetical protein
MPALFLGLGTVGAAALWIGASKTQPTGIHIAVSESDHAAVDAFHKAAISVGAADNGKPGLRADYHPNYYAAFVIDPDGNYAFTTVRSVTKTVRIACDPQAAFDFLADLGNWPLWAVVNVKSTSRTDDPDWWDMVTPHGTARPGRHRANEAQGAA